jgi:hypothetical protein
MRQVRITMTGQASLCRTQPLHGESGWRMDMLFMCLR